MSEATYAGLTLLGDRFEDLALQSTHDRKGENKEKLEAFMWRNHLRESKKRVIPKWRVLFHGVKPLRTEEGKDFVRLMNQVSDHAEIFIRKNGWVAGEDAPRYVWTSQPYRLTVGTYRQLEQACAGMGLHCDISYKDAWYYPGAAPLIVVSRFPLQLTK